jgi:hypothetical protein
VSGDGLPPWRGITKCRKAHACVRCGGTIRRGDPALFRAFKMGPWDFWHDHWRHVPGHCRWGTKGGDLRPGRYRAITDVTIRLMLKDGERTPRTVKVMHARKGEEITLDRTYGGHYYAGGVTAEEQQSLRDLGIPSEITLERVGDEGG